MQLVSYEVRRGRPTLGNSTKNIDTLDRGGEVAADPFLNAGYLARMIQNVKNSFPLAEKTPEFRQICPALTASSAVKKMSL
jgi:hypothetical protein